MEPDWKRCRHWLLWWKADPAELREGSLFASRWIGALLAAEVAVVTASAAYRLMPYGLDFAMNPAFAIAGVVLLALALGWLVFGGMLLWGHRAALPGLIVLGTIEFAAVGGMLLAAGCEYWPYHATRWPILRAGLLLIPTWTCLMHIYTIAFRIGRQRARTSAERAFVAVR